MLSEHRASIEVQNQKVSHDDERLDRSQASRTQEHIQDHQNILISVSEKNFNQHQALKQ